MKIIAILDNHLGVGGGFDQALNAITQMKKMSMGRFEFEVFTTHKSNLKYLNSIGINSIFLKLGLTDKLIYKLSTNTFWQTLQRKIRVICPFERKLISHNCDLVYFLTPNPISLYLQKLNYIITLWDLSHRDSPEFPEVREFNAFYAREQNFLRSLSKAFLIITDSQELSNVVMARYGIDKERLLSMPFSPSQLIGDVSSTKTRQVLLSYDLTPGYLFYPAQFWAHKNHVRILQALHTLKAKYNYKPKLVFTGKDYGNLEHVIKLANELGVVDQVRILGFVPSEHIRPLYLGSSALVMATYFGYTNLPPLEAWLLKVPLIYSIFFKEQAKDAALYFDPDDAFELAKMILKIREPDIREKLIKAGSKRLKEIEQDRLNSESLLLVALKKFSHRRECW